eukprot:COSAG02_NODE_3150_length_7280_cov_8.158892_6_plen_67_part_01
MRSWDASDDESVRELAKFVREHRVTLANELAGHVRQVNRWNADLDEPIDEMPEEAWKALCDKHDADE